MKVLSKEIPENILLRSMTCFGSSRWREDDGASKVYHINFIGYLDS